MERKESNWCRSGILLRRAAVFAVLMLAAQTALWAITVTLRPGRGTGNEIVLDSEDPALQATDINHLAEGQFFMEGEKLWFRFPFCPGSFTAPAEEDFKGWYINAEDGAVQTNGYFHILTEDLVLIAKWDAVEYNYYDDEVQFKYAISNKSPREVKITVIDYVEDGNLTIPASVTHGGETYSVVEIGDEVGKDNNDMTTLTIPATVRRIGTEAFKNCKNLGTVTFQEGSQLTSAGKNAFCDCQRLKYIYNIPCSVKSDEGDMFESNGGLVEVTIWGNNGTVNQALNEINYASSVKMTVPANKFGDDYWTTFYHGLANFQADESTTVYKAVLNGSSLQLHEVADRIISMCEPVILKYTPPQGQTATGNIVLSKTDAGYWDGALNDLQPSSSQMEIPAGTYVLYGGTEGLGFYPFSGTQLSDGKAHIVVPASSPVRGYVGFMEETVPGETDIQNPSAPGVQEGAAEGWFTLDGRRLSARPAQPGIYIRSGRKAVIR